jgi:translocation and assembly module TamB
VLVFNSRKQDLDLSGRNLRMDLWYNLLTQTYKGKISLQPLYAVRGKNTPVVFTLDLPVVLDRHKIGFDDAKITTAASTLSLNGSVENLNNPSTKIRLNGQLAMSDLKALGDLPLNLKAKDVPQTVNVDANAVMANDRIDVNGLRVTAGSSDIEASGTLLDPKGNGSLQFKTRLALDEVGRIAEVAARPGGVLVAEGAVILDRAKNYHVAGTIEGRNLSFVQGGERIRNIDFHTTVDMDPKQLNLKGLRLSAFGGQFNGDLSMEEFARYRLNGKLQNFDLQAAARVAGQKLPYDGVVSGPVQAEGDLKAPGNKLATANAQLLITPGRRGIPVSGRLNARYNGATGNVDVANSYIALPNTRLDLSGSLNNRLNLNLNSSNLNDLLAAAGPQAPAVKLDGGRASFTGAVTGGLSSPRIAGHIALSNFSVEGRKFDSFDADVAASKSRATLENGKLTRRPMEATMAASVGLRNWSAKPSEPLQATVAVRNGDLADIMALAGQPPAGYAGAVTADANIGGTVGNPNGQATIAMTNGTLQDQPFDRLDAKINLSDQLVTIPNATLKSGPASTGEHEDRPHSCSRSNESGRACQYPSPAEGGAQCERHREPRCGRYRQSDRNEGCQGSAQHGVPSCISKCRRFREKPACQQRELW